MRGWLFATLIALALLVAPAAIAQDEVEEAEDEDRGPLPPLPWDAPRAGEQACDDEEILVLRDLRNRARELDRRETALDEREEALQTLERQVEERLAELATMRGELEAMATREQVATDTRVDELARMVDTMKARDAAAMLAGMNQDVVLKVLRRLKPKQAGKVLGEMPPATATTLGDRMTLMDDPRPVAGEEEGS
jgi:flagellar motility protein MotE (MotC chaperone)